MQTSAIIGHLNELFKIANSTYPVVVSRSVRNQYNASGEYVMSQLRNNGVWCVSTPRSAKGPQQLYLQFPRVVQNGGRGTNSDPEMQLFVVPVHEIHRTCDASELAQTIMLLTVCCQGAAPLVPLCDLGPQSQRL